jgi:branched-chain amino acid transport system ATP-binding protein
LAILLVEQLVEKALRHANFVYLIETGRVAAADTADAMREGDLVRRVYLGGGGHDS